MEWRGRDELVLVLNTACTTALYRGSAANPTVIFKKKE